MDSGSLWVFRWTKALSGTGVEVEVELLLELPPPPLLLVVRELEALALWDAAEVPEVPDNTLLEDDREELEVPDRLLLERFNTPEDVALSDEPLLLAVGDNRLFPEDAEDPAPAPEEEPAVFEATVVGVPLVVDWM